MRIQTVSDLSGLSRSQINLLISRYSVGDNRSLLLDEPGEGLPRNFIAADVFTFCIAGRAAALGCSMQTIRDILVSLPPPQPHAASFRAREIFPTHANATETVFLVVRLIDGAFNSVFVTGDRLWAAQRPCTASFVFNASAIAAEIEAADDQ